MNVCVNYFIDNDYTSDVYFKSIINIRKNDKKKTITLENKSGQRFVFKDYLIESVIIGVNPDYKERIDRKWN